MNFAGTCRSAPDKLKNVCGQVVLPELLRLIPACEDAAGQAGYRSVELRHMFTRQARMNSVRSRACSNMQLSARYSVLLNPSSTCGSSVGSGEFSVQNFPCEHT